MCVLLCARIERGSYIRRERRRELFVAFIDLEEAYDRVNRVKLWEALSQAQVGEGLVRAVQSLYMECEARVKVGEKQSERFNVD